MKRIGIIILVLLMALTACAKVNVNPEGTDVKKQETENANQATTQVKKTFEDFTAEMIEINSDASGSDVTNGTVFEKSVFTVFKGSKTYYYLFTNGQLLGPNDEYASYASDEYIKITHAEMDLIPEDTVVYLAPGSLIPDDLLEKAAMRTLDGPVTSYRNPKSDADDVHPLPDEAIFVVKLNGKTLYFMCMNDAIKDQDKSYKKLIKSDEYVLDSDYSPMPVQLYIKLDETYYEEQAKLLAQQAMDVYQMPNAKDESKLIPDGAIFAVKYEGTTYYFICENGEIKDQSKDYKTRTKSADYTKYDMELVPDVTLYLKK